MYNINVNLIELITERIAFLEKNMREYKEKNLSEIELMQIIGKLKSEIQDLKEQLAEANERNKILESRNNIANILQNLN